MNDEQQTDMSLLSNTLGGSVSEFLARRAGITEESKPEAKERQAADYSKDLEALRAQLGEVSKVNSELNGRFQEVTRQNDTLKQYLASQAQQQQAIRAQQPEQLGPIEHEDPQIAAVLNTIDQRMAKRQEEAVRNLNQQQFQISYWNEVARANDALARVKSEIPDFANLVSDHQITEFVKPFLDNPSTHGRMNWEKEFRLAAQTAEHPRLAAENAELKRKLEQYEKQDQRNKQTQQKNLAKVTTIGRGSGIGGEDRSVPTYDRLAAQYRKANGGKKVTIPWEVAGKAIFEDAHKKYNG